MTNYQIDKDLNLALRQKYNPDGSILRKAQMRMLKMLKYLDKICIDNGIEYWLESGTLLGAVRHGGFIPWDDDVDIVMTRKNAKKLDKILLAESNNCDFVLQSHKTDPYHYLFWNRLRDVKSANVAHTFVRDHLKYNGLGIDIFILDDNIIDWLQQKCITLNHYMLTLPLGDNTGKWIKLRPLVPLFYWGLSHVILPIARFVSFFKKNDYLSYSYAQPWKRKYPKDAIYPLNKIQFEGSLFMSPANPDRYLSVAFGDWRQIPSKKDIHTHKTQFELYFD